MFFKETFQNIKDHFKHEVKEANQKINIVEEHAHQRIENLEKSLNDKVGTISELFEHLVKEVEVIKNNIKTDAHIVDRLTDKVNSLNLDDLKDQVFTKVYADISGRLEEHDKKEEDK